MIPIPQPAPTNGNTSWFTHDRFGLFIHWGLYSMGARHEWVKNHERMTDDQYQNYFDNFDPDLYDPESWAKAAKEAGMKYFVITTKHHEGFCLWDSKLTDYKAPNTPANRDLLKPMVDAFRKEGLKVGFYYSLLDWHHPDYTIDSVHPQRDLAEAEALNEQKNFDNYVEYLHGQTEELLTQFGKIDILWYDFSILKTEKYAGKGKNEWQSERLIEKIRQWQPEIILNDRLEIDQDVKTPEQYQPTEWVTSKGKPVVWEACQTFSGSWGYHREESSWKSPEMLIQMLVDSVSKGGNLLLNVGPTARGEFDDRALDRLEAMGQWMYYHSRSIYGCTQAPYEAPTDVRYTYNPDTNRLYAHLFAYPYRHLQLPGLVGKVKYAQLLNDASEVRILNDIPEMHFGSGSEDMPKDKNLIIELPVVKPEVAMAVIELMLH